MRQKGRFFISIFIILILLPYVATVLLQSRSARRTQTDWEEYLLGELASEISGDAPLEAVKAQAVIARTMFYKKAAGGEEVQELFEDPQDLWERWGGAHYEEYYAKFRQAITETKHQVLKYNDALIDASYHQLSAGTTRNASEAGLSEAYGFLQAKSCEHDQEADGFARETIFTEAELAKRLEIDVDEAANLAVGQTDSSGYALTVTYGDEQMNAEEFAEKLGLLSACMTFTKADGALVVTTKGAGHGLGLSQYAARVMAEEGSGYRDILSYFYTDIQIADGGELSF